MDKDREICGNCVHHRKEWSPDGEWYCNNRECDYYTDLTDYDDGCDEFESRWSDI